MATPAPRTGELLVRLAESLHAVDTAPSPVAGGGAGGAAVAAASPETPPGEAGVDGGASGAGGSGDAGGAGGGGGEGEGGGEERQAPSSPMKDLVLEPPALAVAGVGPVSAAVVEEQYLDHVLEALVRARGIVLPRVRSVDLGLLGLWTADRVLLVPFWWCGDLRRLNYRPIARSDEL